MNKVKYVYVFIDKPKLQLRGFEINSNLHLLLNALFIFLLQIFSFSLFVCYIRSKINSIEINLKPIVILFSFEKKLILKFLKL